MTSRRLSILILPLLVVGCERHRPDDGAARADSVRASFSESPMQVTPPVARPERMLFSLYIRDDGTASLDAVARVAADGSITGPAPDSALGEAFHGRWLNPGHGYTVLSGGRPIGTVAVTANHQEGCGSLSAAARPALRQKPWNALGALASNLPLESSASLAAPASPAEREAMTALLRREIEARGGTWKDAEVRVSRIALYGGPFALAGSARVAPSPENDAAPVYAAFQIAEPGPERGRWTTVTWYHGPNDGLDDEFPRSRDLVDVVDLDGDGTPELVTRTAFYEAWSYTIYRRRPNGWAEVYTGAGGGC